MTRKSLTSINSNCPRCKFNDKVNTLRVSKISDNVRQWFKDNTTYTEDQLKEANHYCDRCLIVFKRMETLKA